MRRLSFVGLLLLIACTRHRTRDPAHDASCEDKGKLAFAFEDQPAAEAAGCSAIRIYRESIDSAGRHTPDEDVAYCCPK